MGLVEASFLNQGCMPVPRGSSREERDWGPSWGPNPIMQVPGVEPFGHDLSFLGVNRDYHQRCIRSCPPSSPYHSTSTYLSLGR
jgi:hypothetical protein